MVLPSIFSPGVVSQAATLQKTYSSAAPFPHGVLEPLVDPAFLRSVRKEVIAQELQPKETDLYRLRQSIDFSNFDSLLKKHPALAEQISNIVRLRDALYSSEFRSLVSETTGCGPLTTKVDLAASLYTNGSHLLLHDDVISTRRVAFILYLTLNDASGTSSASEWTEEDGGCLQLYPPSSDDPSVPSAVSGAQLLPLFNRFAFFTVEAGRSFHAVQEVFALEKERLSIQGWFHAAHAPHAHATPLKQLKQLAEPFAGRLVACRVHCPRSSGGEVELSAKVVRELQQMGMHPMYFDPSNLAQLAAEFAEKGVVRLGNLLMPVLVDPLLEHLRVIDVADGLGLGQAPPPNELAGVDSNWFIRGPAHIRRHLELKEEVTEGDDGDQDQVAGAAAAHKSVRTEREGNTPSEAAAGVAHARTELAMMLSCIRDRLLASDAFAIFVSALVSAKLPQLGLHARYTAARRFRPGLDYTLATVPHPEPLLQVIYSLCNGVAPNDEEDEEDEEEGPTVLEEGEEDDELGFWESCEVGGFDCFVKAENDSTAGSVMATSATTTAAAGGEEGKGEDAVLNLPCDSNCLSIVLRNPDQMHFTKYVQAAAPGSRLDVYQAYVLRKFAGAGGAGGVGEQAAAPPGKRSAGAKPPRR